MYWIRDGVHSVALRYTVLATTNSQSRAKVYRTTTVRAGDYTMTILTRVCCDAVGLLGLED